MKTITLTHGLSDLGAFLRGTDADEIIARTTYIPGGWHEAEFAAHRAGFQIAASSTMSTCATTPLQNATA